MNSWRRVPLSFPMEQLSFNLEETRLGRIVIGVIVSASSFMVLHSTKQK